MDLLIFLRNKISYKILSVQIHFNLGHISILKKPHKLHFFLTTEILIDRGGVETCRNPLP